MTPVMVVVVAALEAGAAVKKSKPIFDGLVLIIMNKEFSITITAQNDIPEIIAFLIQNKLPAEDVAENIRFWIIKDGERIIGTIGLEVFGEYGLLRSLATDAEYRKTGIAAALIDSLFIYSATRQLHEIYLLTETAEAYFQKKGFGKIDRNDAPEILRSSTEFSTVCPVSAVCMKKNVT